MWYLTYTSLCGNVWDQKDKCGSQFPSLTMWIPGIKLRSSDSVTDTITHWALSLGPDCLSSVDSITLLEWDVHLQLSSRLFSPCMCWSGIHKDEHKQGDEFSNGIILWHLMSDKSQAPNVVNYTFWHFEMLNASLEPPINYENKELENPESQSPCHWRHWTQSHTELLPPESLKFNTLGVLLHSFLFSFL